MEVELKLPTMRTHNRRIPLAALLLAALSLSGCAASTAGSTTTQTPSPPAPVAVATSTTSGAHRPPHRSQAGHPHRPPAPSSNQSGSLVYSTASNDVVQPQPAPGTCHAIGSGLYSRPDPRCTPGALNPAVTQSDINQTICVAGWTGGVRPPEAVTEVEKRASMAAYSESAPIWDYEYDHLVPLELGGAVNDPRNLWPEPGASPNPKDQVEDELNREVCDGQLTLAQAQRTIATDWLTAPGTSPGPELGDAPPGTTTAAAPSGTPSVSSAATCSMNAMYDPSHDDYDVYVNSNQPDETVTVTDAAGHSNSWHTNSSGYADVYFHAGREAPGQTITAQVGGASCSTTL